MFNQTPLAKMEFIINNQAVLEQLPALSPNGVGISSSAKPFIEANTIAMPVKEMQDQHVIPIWSATNEPLISHSDFIETTWGAVHKVFKNEQILKPNVRVSHAIKGRIPEAKSKAAKDLEPWESTIYYERMMFVIEIPTIITDVCGNPLSLTVGGVKSYNLDNLYSKRPNKEQHFQIFIGFQNRVCCNMCVSTDGIKQELGIKNTTQLSHAIEHLLCEYNPEKHLKSMRRFGDIELTETEFAQIVGRARMYKHMPSYAGKNISPLLMGDQQISSVVNDFYKDPDFGNLEGGSISLWRFYNLLTGANKSSYIDAFLERGVNASDFTAEVIEHKSNVKRSWFMG
jgi:hypothetical protein